MITFLGHLHSCHSQTSWSQLQTTHEWRRVSSSYTTPLTIPFYRDAFTHYIKSSHNLCQEEKWERYREKIVYKGSMAIAVALSQMPRHWTRQRIVFARIPHCPSTNFGLHSTWYFARWRRCWKPIRCIEVLHSNVHCSSAWRWVSQHFLKTISFF